MNWRQLDLNLLKTVYVLYEEKSVARAAHRLSVSPSAVSHALRRLRLVMNDQLFVLVGKQMVPTHKAIALRPSLEAFIASLDILFQQNVGEGTANVTRTFTLVMPGAVEIVLLPKIIQSTRKIFPLASIKVLPFERRSYEIELLHGHVDFVFSIGEIMEHSKHIKSQYLWSDKLVVLYGPNAHIYNNSTLELHELMQLSYAYFLPWQSNTNHFDSFLARNDLRRKVFLHTHNYSCLEAMVMNTDLVAVVPKLIAIKIIANNLALKYIELSNDFDGKVRLNRRVIDERDIIAEQFTNIITDAAVDIEPLAQL